MKLIAFALFATATLHAADPIAVSAFKFSPPEGWASVQPKSPIRKAQLSVPGKEGGKPAEVVFFHFGGGQGGDVQSNVQRWYAQFAGTADKQKSEAQEWGGTKVTIVSTEGTLKASPNAGIPEDQPDSALLGAILEHSDGPVFVKMTGPKELVNESREKFIALVKGAVEKK